jgi:hypothetical protein
MTADLSQISVGQLAHITIEPDEQQRLMDRLQTGRKLSKNDAYKVCAILLRLIEQDENHTDAKIFLAALSARYGIEIIT